MIIRPARPADAPAAAAVHCASWREAYRDVLPAALLAALTEEFRARQWRDWLAAGRDGLFVAEDADGAIIGVLRVMAAEGTAAEGAASEIDLLHVPAPFRRRGAGRALLGAAAGWAGQTCPGPVGLWVLHGNDRAARF
ncbi:MAG: GNAT family N-acetyltransferase [Methylobacteriaceae bacterium]|nr:GNAT family N-acetyltransferase [Methylobacteriaceae bacterium]